MKLHCSSPTLFLFLLLSFLLSTTAWAQASFETVSSNADSGNGSLRQVVQNATPGSLIIFSEVLSGDTIHLTSGPISIGTTLTIYGPEDGKVHISGSGIQQILQIQSGADVLLRDMHLIDGKASGGAKGGAIDNQGTLRLQAVHFSNNQAEGTFDPLLGFHASFGGALFNDGTLYAQRCIFRNNQLADTSGSASGGALANLGIADLQYCTFAENMASIKSGAGSGTAKGGAIYNEGRIDAYGCTFDKNKASGESQLNNGSGIGGAVLTLGYFHAVASTFSGNSAIGAGFFGGTGFGGAIFNQDTLILDQVTISGNQVAGGGLLGGANGGGIMTYGYATILQSTITANQTFDTSSATSTGGGLEIRGQVELGGTILIDNKAWLGPTLYTAGSDANLGGGGSAISLGYNLIGINTSLNFPPSTGNMLNPASFQLDPLADNGGPTMTHALPIGSPAIDAGDITLMASTDQRGYPSLVNGRRDIGAFEQGPCEIWITNNQDDGPGSLRHALSYAQAGCDIKISQTLAGQAIILTSGEISIARNLKLDGLTGSTILLRSDRTSRLLKIQDQVSFSLSNMTLVLGNAYDKAGGAIVNRGTLSLSNISITNCFAFTGNAIYNTGDLTLNKCKLERNGIPTLVFQLVAGVEGGAIYNEGTLKVKESLFAQNTAGVGSGGGIAKGGAIYNAGTASVHTSSFTQNKAGGGSNGIVVTPAGYGGGIYNTGSLDITTCLFSANEAKAYGEKTTSSPPNNPGMGIADGGAIYSLGNLTLRSSTFSQNISNLQSRVDEVSNWAPSSVGGVYSDQGMLTGCTFVNNVAGLTGAINGGTNTLIGNNLIAGNSGTNNLSDGISAGYNLIDELKNTNWPALATDLAGSTSAPIDPLLGPLADNEGPTLTYALGTNSPAINAGNPDSPQDYDQRGYARPMGGRSDIGAFEAHAAPIIHIVDPIAGDSTTAMFKLSARAEINGLEIPYLQVNCPDFSHRRLRMANNPNSVWGPRVDVTTGGNDHLVMRIRDPQGNINWPKIGFYPNGINSNPIKLAAYLPANPGTDWITIRIPLADFDPRISFQQLAYIEFPSSQKAGPFELHIGEVTFTGGTTPYRWFGLDKLDNFNDGDGARYHMDAQLQGGAVAAYVTSVQFELDGQYVGEDLLSPYAFEYGYLAPGTYALTATAILSDGNCFRSPPVDIIVTEPKIHITTPRDSSVFTAPADLTIRAEVEGITGPDYLTIISPDNSYRKLGLGHNPTSIWGPNVDVTVGGNNKMEITLRDPNRNANWNKMEIHPQGSVASPVSVANYLPPQGIDENWVTISIPLSDFASSIDFTQISYLEIPYSRKAGPFEIDIQQIRFTGGNQPFLWLGPGKMDNAHNGFGKRGQLDATLIRGNGNGPVTKVDFYANGILLGTDLDAPYSYDWLQIPVGNYQLVSQATLSAGFVISSDPVYVVVNSGMREGLVVEDAFDIKAFPNPVSDRLTLNFNLNEAEVLAIHLIDMNGKRLLSEELWFSAGASSHSLDLTGLPAGVYMLGVYREFGKVVNLKVVKR